MRFKDIVVSFFKYMFLSIIISVFLVFDDSKEFFNQEKLYVFMIFLVISFVMFLSENIYFYFINKSNQKKYDYYRELPSDYSPSIISLLMNSKIEYKKDILADLIFLEQRGFIKIDENKNILIINDSRDWKCYEEHLNLIMTELFKMDNPTVDKILKMRQYHKLNKILDFLHNYLSSDETYNTYGHSTNLTFPVKYFKAVKNSSYEAGLAKKYSVLNFLTIIFKISLFMFIGLSLIFIIFKINFENMRIFEDVFGYILILCIIIYVYRAFTEKDTVRLKKGKKEIALWYSFYSFLKHFSRLHTRNLEEKELWGYYFAYGLSLGVNKKVMKKFNLEYEKYIIK